MIDLSRGVTLVVLALATAQAPAQRSGDHIAAVVNQELVTAGEVQQRIERARQEAARSGVKLPPAGTLRRQVLNALIDERVQVSYARDSGLKIDEAELDRAVANIAAQNQLTIAQLRQRLLSEGVNNESFRRNVRDQMLVERVREREVRARIQITEREVDELLDQQRASAGNLVEYNVAQILIAVPGGADGATVSARRRRAESAFAQVRAGKAFARVAREFSEDSNKARGGEIGLRPAARLPDAFVAVVSKLKVGEVAPNLLRTGAGFHVIKLLDRREGAPFTITQSRVRHILLRPSARLTLDAALRRLAEFKRQIEAGSRPFEQMARENSDDASAMHGGNLGWVSPGTLVPEFEENMNALAGSELAEPFVSRFGAHLIQVLERRTVALDAKQQREQARNLLREQKFEAAYAEWTRDLRARAYIELRDPPP